ncbi:hypothetical protein AGMMS49938_18300 [Fibrobacterales bacterium]|nr:hypothetical protein AGMMS49938_18300 [Fibrobacterales bacterium]
MNAIAAAALRKNFLFISHLGARVAAGASAFRGHKALLVNETHAVKLQPAFSVSAGLAFAIEISDLISVAPELQYSWYRANGELIKENIGEFNDLYEAGASLHAIEIPILARFNFGCLYAEAGPQIGANIYTKIYKNSDLKKPELNVFTFGPTLGGGVKLGDILLGIRGHFGILEYAKETGGSQWNLQVGATKFFF